MFLFPLIFVVDVVNKGEVLTDNAGQSVDGKFLVVMLTLLWDFIFTHSTPVVKSKASSTTESRIPVSNYSNKTKKN
ncbi:hypothetical protein EB796_023168 [Bugula neritina]|uniref:Uncharacterized protein n=1 Tax=Bugula neritina TaxID=10212 RepID=A0A7J7IY92_BUGNE|nr:hypothetical protein EB796_023168 [Bugula neritina]